MHEQRQHRHSKSPWSARGIAVVVALALAPLFALAGPAAAITPTYKVTTDVSARSAPVAAPGGYGIPAGGSFVALCQVIGQPVGPKGNTLYFYVAYQGRNFYVPDTYTTSPHLAGQPPIPGIPMCKTSTAPAPTTKSIGNRIADLALTYQGRWGGNACIDAHLGSNGYVGVYSGGQCRQFVNCLLWRASGHRYNGYAPDYTFPGATRVTASQATRGDIIQKGIGGHTAVILRNYGGGRYQVVDSNFSWNVDSNFSWNEHVSVHDYAPPSTATFWRYGQTATG